MTEQPHLAPLVDEAEHDGLARARLAAERADGPVDAASLGAFSAGSRPAVIALRRALITARVPLRAVVAVRPLAVRSGRADRFDRFVRQLAFWTGVRRGIGDRALWKSLSRGPVILMYHAIGGANEHGSCYVVPRRRFALQMAWLKWRRYRVVSLASLASTLRAGQLPPARTVVLTFDDGFADNHDEALPVLRRYRFAATIFLVTGAGPTASWPSDAALNGRPLLTDGQIASCIAHGIDVGAHTRTHPALTRIAPEEQDREIAGSRDDLERRFGARVRTFAYPFGDYNAAIAARVAAAGYDVACCSRSGVNDPGVSLTELRRLEVRGTDSLLDFALLLWRAHRPHRSVRRAPEQAVV